MKSTPAERLGTTSRSTPTLTFKTRRFWKSSETKLTDETSPGITGMTLGGVSGNVAPGGSAPK
jgi:hypothetical protein